jgi:hypothetical protein
MFNIAFIHPLATEKEQVREKKRGESYTITNTRGYFLFLERGKKRRGERKKAQQV